jgi:hypothetical protein
LVLEKKKESALCTHGADEESSMNCRDGALGRLPVYPYRTLSRAVETCAETLREVKGLWRETLRQVKGLLGKPERGEGFMEENLRQVKGLRGKPEAGERFTGKT